MSTPIEQEAVTGAGQSPSPTIGETVPPEVESSEVYEAVAQGDMTFLKAHESEIGSFVSPTKNTILHLYIIAQSKRNQDTSIIQKLQSALKSVPSWFKYATDKPTSPAKTVQAMLKEWPWLLQKANASGDTPLHMAARHGDDGIVKVLIDHAKNSHGVDCEDVEEGGQVVRTKVEQVVWKMLHETNADRETALHQAVRYQHNDVVKVLTDEDDPSFLYLPNEDGETPLYMAAERSNYELVRMIIERYTSPAYEGPDGRTALHAAAIHSSDAWYYIVSKEGLKCLATKVDHRGRTPLHYDGVLLRYDRSAAFITDNDGKTALHVAASDKERAWDVLWFISNCPECFELVDRQGRNALHIAVESGNKAAVDLILKHEYFGDLLKMKDNNGNTPLHLLAAFPNYWPEMIKDHRFDRMAFNKDKFNPVDIISSNPVLSKVEKSMAKRMEKAEINPGKRASTDPITKNVEENNRNNKSEDEDLKEARESHLVVAALIATVTFAAGFTLPGGYIQEKGPELGYAVFTKNAAFIVFVISDTFGLVFSCAAVFIHLLMAIDGHKEKQTVGKLFGKALPLTLLAIVAMVIAFITGTYAVLAHSPSLAIPASVIGAVFFFLFGYLMEEAHQSSDSFRIFHGMIDMAELLLTAVVRSFMAFEQLLMALWQFYELICSGLVKVFKWCYPWVSKDDIHEDSKRYLELQRSLHRPFDS